MRMQWYENEDGDYAARRSDGLMVGCDDHTTWLVDDMEGYEAIPVTSVDPGYKHRVEDRFALVDRIRSLS